MPTTSIAGELTLTNLGPLTTTFSAPESCTTGWNLLEVAGGNEGPYDGPIVFPGTDCTSRSYSTASLECLPHADKVGSVLTTAYEVFETGWAQMYHSPAYACPHGWETVGVAEMNNGTSSRFGAAFSPTSLTEGVGPDATTSPFPSNDFVGNMIISALGPQETAIACCPSGYHIDQYGADCRSIIPLSELAGSTACMAAFTGPIPGGFVESTRTWEFDGQTTTQTVADVPVDTMKELMITTTATFGANGIPTIVSHSNSSDDGAADENRDLFLTEDSTEIGNWTGYAYVPALYMINNGTNGEDDGEGDDDDDDETDGENDPSDAGSVNPMSVWVTGSTLLVALIVAAAL